MARNRINEDHRLKIFHISHQRGVKKALENIKRMSKTSRINIIWDWKHSNHSKTAHKKKVKLSISKPPLAATNLGLVQG